MRKILLLLLLTCGFSLPAMSQCSRFAPVDQFVNMNGQTPGTTVTTSNLAAATDGTSHSWTTAATTMTFAASQVGTLPAAVVVNNGAGYTCGSATQSLAHDNSCNQSGNCWSILSPASGHSTMVVSGWLANLPPNQGGSGSLWDLVKLDTSGGQEEILQLQNGTDQSCGFYALEIERTAGGTGHSSCIAVTAGGTYYYSFKADFTTTSSTAQLAVYTVSGSTFTQVGSTVSVVGNASGNISIIFFGNVEFGSASGTTTYFQNMMVDWTHATFPNLPSPVNNFTVKAGGGGSFTTIQACVNAMVPGDTCTVFGGASNNNGVYNENVTLAAGATLNYNTVTVNGSDTVSALSFVGANHNKLIGNCPEKQGTVITASCGFFISNPSSPASARCVALNDGMTDIYIKDNVMYACGSYSMVGLSSANSTPGVSNVYIQGNTLSYACVTQAQAQAGTPKECNGIVLHGTNDLVENNDLSHYTLGLHFDDLSLSVMRNNVLHDQIETEAGGNAHTDAYFVEPTATATQHNVIEGNYQHDTSGANAKGMVIQGQDAPCGATLCTGIIFRYNTAANLDGSNLSGFAWDSVKMYNNTYVNVGRVINTSGGVAIDDMRTLSSVSFSNTADINNIYYFGFQVLQAGTSNVWGFDSASAATSTWGHSLAYCNVSGSSNCFLYGHLYNTSTWAAEPGNLYGRTDTNPTNNPNFVNLAGNDFHLQSNSPAIGQGTFLTTANGSGSGSTSLIVSDATYFQDGYGLSNAYSTVNGDCISVTTVGNHVCVTAVNYSTNTLTLANPISWSNGDSVWLYSKSDGVKVLSGSAPDMGAFPTGGLVITPSPVSFVNQQLGTTSSPLTVTVTNSGGSSVTLGTPYYTITGTNAANFTNLGTGTCSNGGVISGGGSCTIILTFVPSALGSATATLTVSAVTATLQGTGVFSAPGPRIFAGSGMFSGQLNSR